MKSTAIINLSALVEYDIEQTKTALKNLLKKYSPSCSPCSSLGFFANIRFGILYKQHEEMIKQYKLGKMTTDEFLTQLKKSFPMLDKDFLLEEDQLSISTQKNTLISLLKRVDDYSDGAPDLKGKALLEIAWTKGVKELTPENWKQMEQDFEKVYFISNTNIMDLKKSLGILLKHVGIISKRDEEKKDNRESIERAFSSPKLDENTQEETPLLEGTKLSKSQQDLMIMMTLLKQEFPEFEFDFSNGCLSVLNAFPPIEIYTSNLCGAFKTLGENAGGTPSLVDLLMKKLKQEGTNMNNVQLISQYSKDFDPAKDYLPKENMMAAEAYFSQKPSIKQKI